MESCTWLNKYFGKGNNSLKNIVFPGINRYINKKEHIGGILWIYT